MLNSTYRGWGVEARIAAPSGRERRTKLHYMQAVSLRDKQPEAAYDSLNRCAIGLPVTEMTRRECLSSDRQWRSVGDFAFDSWIRDFVGNNVHRRL